MVALVIGVPDSGKSALAENLAMELSGDGKRIYLATMEILDDAGKERVEKHRKLREGKGFFTIEAPVKISEAVEDEPDLKDATVLVECISNLVGNMMHDDDFLENKAGNSSIGDVVSAAVLDVTEICNKAKNVVIVTNSFACEEGFDEETKEYVRSLDAVNDRLREAADEIYEFVEGEWLRSENN